MKKIVRLTESDLVRLVKRVINEQYTGTIIPPKKDMVKTGTVKDLTKGDKFLVRSEKGANIYGEIKEVTDSGYAREFRVEGFKISKADLNSSASLMYKKTYYFRLDNNLKLTSSELNRKPVTTVDVDKFQNYMNVKPDGYTSNKEFDNPDYQYENTTNSYYMEQ